MSWQPTLILMDLATIVAIIGGRWLYLKTRPRNRYK